MRTDFVLKLEELEIENRDLQAEVDYLAKENEELIKEKNELIEENEELEARIKKVLELCLKNTVVKWSKIKEEN